MGRRKLTRRQFLEGVGVVTGLVALEGATASKGNATARASQPAMRAAHRNAARKVPSDNPVATYYSGDLGYPAWTDEIHWSTAIDMSTYSNGDNDFERFENARDELYAEGGGVLYYPAGAYDFSDAPLEGPNGRGLMLKSGVVIRGETPTEDPDAISGTMKLRTVFKFPFQIRQGGQVPKDWNLIGITPSPGEQLKNIQDVGVAWVHMIGGTIWFGPQVEWGNTWGTAGSWKSSKVKDTWKDRVPDGTHPMDTFAGGKTTLVGSGRGRLVFGCILQDSAVLNDAIDAGFGPDGFYMYKFGPRIGAYGSNVLVANNLLPKSNRNFKYQQLTSSGKVKTILFDYGKTYGIDINKDLLGLVHDGYFRPGVVVRDNYVFNHGSKGFSIAGKWVTIQSNHNERVYLKEGDDLYGLGPGWELTMDGYLESQAGGSGPVSDNLSRAFDLGGQALWIDHNTFNNTGSDPGNDGEGILCQLNGGTQLYSWAVTRNAHVQGSGEPGYMGSWGVTDYGFLIAWNTTPGWVGDALADNVYDAAYVDNRAASGAKTESRGIADVITSCPEGTPSPPADVTIEVEGDHVMIRWTDTANSEIGFRVDRLLPASNWTTVAYRPRHSCGVKENEQAWADYTLPTNVRARYRVAAINCSDGNSGAAPATMPVKIHKH